MGIDKREGGGRGIEGGRGCFVGLREGRTGEMYWKGPKRI